jgi:hypothetical protein
MGNDWMSNLGLALFVLFALIAYYKYDQGDWF